MGYQSPVTISKSSQEYPEFSKAPNEDLKDMDVLCPFKIKIESQNLEQGCIKDQWPYKHQDQYVKPSSGTSTLKIIIETQIWSMGVSKTSDHILIKI